MCVYMCVYVYVYVYVCVRTCLCRYILFFLSQSTPLLSTPLHSSPLLSTPLHSSPLTNSVISPHKFPGGPGTPGVLIAKRKLFTNTVPTVPGGGTTEIVTSSGQKYVKDIESREEGGTPPILQAIRAGLVFKLKDTVGTDSIMKVGSLIR